MEIHPYHHSFEKKLFDFSVALFLIFLLIPIFILLNLSVVLTAGWPIFFLQKRRGLNKKTFKIIKFRTMYVGAQKNQWRYQKHSSAPAPMYKNWADPRFVGIGRWLSKTGLDELPQLLNILKGEMSFIGPRPLPVYEAEKLNKSWDFRYQVRPGIFSEWSAKTVSKMTLKKWKRLEKETLTRGGLKYEISTIFKTLKKIIS